jgi:Transposase DDE domain
MLLEPIFERFVQRSPFAVMSRAILEYALCPRALDELFERQADKQYTRELLFSSTVDLMSLVVTCTYSSVRAAYVDEAVDLSVSLTSVYNKLQGIEAPVCAELVRHTANRLQPVVAYLGGGLDEPIPGYRMHILDGNHLAATEHRLKETRDNSAAPLPGQSLCVYEPAWQMVTDIVLCEDGHAQERSLLDRVLDKIRQRDLWLADRNFCVKWFLLAIARRLGFFIIREHEQLNYCKAGKLRRKGRVETGQVLEQSVCLEDDETGEEYWMRRVVVRLDEPTRDGDVELALITNLPGEVSARAVADAYRKRWTIETGFADLTTTLCCEINTLCYPRAALFAFCVAVAAYNVQSAIKGVLRAAHGQEKIEADFSRYFMAGEIARVHEGMMIALPAQEWVGFRDMPLEEFAAFLRKVAQQVQLHRYPKSHRGPKKPKPKRRYSKKHPHVSTARLLNERKANKQRAKK